MTTILSWRTITMNLLYGTYNVAKLKSMQKTLASLPINIMGLDSIEGSLEEPVEDGKIPLENARAKALGYYKQVKEPIFSCDSGLYFEGVDEEDQPGVMVRRVKGKCLNDQEMIRYYSKLAAKYGGRLKARYRNAICLVMNEEDILEYDGEDIWWEEFFIVSEPHHHYTEGFPLDSLSVEKESGRYYNDIEASESDDELEKGFRDFFIRSLGLKENVYASKINDHKI